MLKRKGQSFKEVVAVLEGQSIPPDPHCAELIIKNSETTSGTMTKMRRKKEKRRSRHYKR
jgi:hypothetical protein